VEATLKVFRIESFNTDFIHITKLLYANSNRTLYFFEENYLDFNFYYISLQEADSTNSSSEFLFIKLRYLLTQYG